MNKILLILFEKWETKQFNEKQIKNYGKNLIDAINAKEKHVHSTALEPLEMLYKNVW